MTILYLTYKEWREEGFVVAKGETSHRKNKAGVPLFSEDQVVEDEYSWADSHIDLE